MFLKLNHQKLDVYQAPRKFIIECYRLLVPLPSEENSQFTIHNSPC